MGERKTFTVVGDDDQSIYAWRGARPENLVTLGEDFPRLKVIKLEQNYRSTGTILRAANTLIANNPHVFEKTLWRRWARAPDPRAGQPPRGGRGRAGGQRDPDARRISSAPSGATSPSSTGATSRPGCSSSCAALPDPLQALRRHLLLLAQRDQGRHGLPAAADQPGRRHAFLRIVNTPRREIGPSTLEKLANYATERGIACSPPAFELGLAEHLPARAVERLQGFADWLVEFVIARPSEGDPSPGSPGPDR
jgi:ATP-dependent DNA helicase Rep